MKILMLAPEPFLTPRGTPVSIYFRIKALSELGHKVHLITYHLGEDVHLKNARIYRIPCLFFIRRIKIGASLAKIFLDVLLFLKAIIRLTREKYDLIFSHEEAALIGVMLAKIWRRPHIYDMHSSLPQQIKQWKSSGTGVLTKIFSWIENFILRNTQAVMVICPELLIRTKDKGHRAKTVLLENFMDFEQLSFSGDQIQKMKKRLAPQGEKIILYAGNFQPYQGLNLLLEAAAGIDDKNTLFVLVGGTTKEIKKMQEKAESLRILKRACFEGEVSPFILPLYLSAADVLVSPRLQGTATPLKIYSYLRSGKPVVATNLLAHTQILDEKVSTLVPPDPKGLARGLTFALHHPEAKQRAQAAKKWMESNYSPSLYLEKMNQALKKAMNKRGDSPKRKPEMTEERVGQFYDHLWSKYIPQYSASRKHWEIFYHSAEARDKLVLDAGCGTGIFSFIFAKKGASRVVGIDISEHSLKTAQCLKKKYGVENTDFQKVNMLKLPFQNASFDMVWAWGAVHHTTEPLLAIEELIRVLKHEGSLLLAIYRKTGLTFLHETLRRILLRLPKKTWGPFSFMLSLVLAPVISLFKKKQKSRKGEKLEELILDWFFVPLKHYFLPAQIKAFLQKRGLVIEKYLPYSGRFNSTSNFILKARKASPFP